MHTGQVGTIFAIFGIGSSLLFWMATLLFSTIVEYHAAEVKISCYESLEVLCSPCRELTLKNTKEQEDE